MNKAPVYQKQGLGKWCPTRNDPSVGDDSGIFWVWSWENHPYKSRCSNMGLSVLGWHFSMGIHANPGCIHHPCWFFAHPGSSRKIMLFSPLTTSISCYIPHNPWIPLVYPQWTKLSNGTSPVINSTGIHRSERPSAVGMSASMHSTDTLRHNSAVRRGAMAKMQDVQMSVDIFLVQSCAVMYAYTNIQYIHMPTKQTCLVSPKNPIPWTPRLGVWPQRHRNAFQLSSWAGRPISNETLGEHSCVPFSPGAVAHTIHLEISLCLYKKCV